MGEVHAQNRASGPRKKKFKRSKDGCITCRIRKIKCDLTRPNCTKCTSTGRKCDGYPTPPGLEPQPQRALDTPLSLGRTPCERLCLDFFYHVSAPSYVNFGSHYFWNSLVIQACFHEDSIRHLVLAATTLDLREQGWMGDAKSNLAFEIHYGKALELLGSVSDPQPAILLMACLLFVLCDEYRNDRSGVQRHLVAGRRIVRSLHDRRCSELDDTLTELTPIFKRLDAQTEFPKSPFSTGGAASELDSARWGRPSTQDVSWGTHRPSLFKGYSSANMASDCLQMLVPACMHPAEASKDIPRTRFHIVPNATAQLNQWLTYFNESVKNFTVEERRTKSKDIDLLRATHTSLHVMSRCAPYLREDAYDRFAEQFDLLIDSLTGILDKSTPDPLMERALSPIFFVAAHCRSPGIRRRAVELLKNCGWPGIRMARIAQEIIALEEGLKWTESSADVSLDRRIRVLDISFTSSDAQTSSSQCVISWSKTPFDGSNNGDNSFQWEDLPADSALQQSVKRLWGRVARFEMIAICGQKADEISTRTGRE